jgi:ribosomal protein S27E
MGHSARPAHLRNRTKHARLLTSECQGQPSRTAPTESRKTRQVSCPTCGQAIAVPKVEILPPLPTDLPAGPTNIPIYRDGDCRPDDWDPRWDRFQG